MYGRMRSEWSYWGTAGCPEHDEDPRKGRLGDTLFVEAQARILPGSTSEDLIALGSVSGLLGRKAAAVGLVGDGGGKLRGDGLGGGLDASVTLAILMVDGTRRRAWPLGI
jgi:hypothetical protein